MVMVLFSLLLEVAQSAWIPPRCQQQLQRRISIRVARTQIQVRAATPPNKPPRNPLTFGTGSYVDDGDYGSAEEEIEAMGGDPFFLHDNQQVDDPEEQEKDTDPDFEWDGIEVEDAHMD